MRLTQHEVNFIILATTLSSGVFDYDMEEKAFKKMYGLSMEEAETMLSNLKTKVFEEANKKHLKKIAKEINKGNKL